MQRGEEIARAHAQQLLDLTAAARQGNGSVDGTGSAVLKTNPTHQLITIEDVVITGNVSTRNVSLLHDAGIRKGQTIEAEKLAKRIENVFGGGFFESVKFGLEKGSGSGSLVQVCAGAAAHVEHRRHPAACGHRA